MRYMYKSINMIYVQNVLYRYMYKSIMRYMYTKVLMRYMQKSITRYMQKSIMRYMYKSKSITKVLRCIYKSIMYVQKY